MKNFIPILIILSFVFPVSLVAASRGETMVLPGNIDAQELERVEKRAKYLKTAAIVASLLGTTVLAMWYFGLFGPKKDGKPSNPPKPPVPKPPVTPPPVSQDTSDEPEALTDSKETAPEEVAPPVIAVASPNPSLNPAKAPPTAASPKGSPAPTAPAKPVVDIAKIKASMQTASDELNAKKAAFAKQTVELQTRTTLLQQLSAMNPLAKPFYTYKVTDEVRAKLLEAQAEVTKLEELYTNLNQAENTASSSSRKYDEEDLIRKKEALEKIKKLSQQVSDYEAKELANVEKQKLLKATRVKAHSEAIASKTEVDTAAQTFTNLKIQINLTPDGWKHLYIQDYNPGGNSYASYSNYMNSPHTKISVDGEDGTHISKQIAYTSYSGVGGSGYVRLSLADALTLSKQNATLLAFQQSIAKHTALVKAYASSKSIEQAAPAYKEWQLLKEELEAEKAFILSNLDYSTAQPYRSGWNADGTKSDPEKEFTSEIAIELFSKQISSKEDEFSKYEQADAEIVSLKAQVQDFFTAAQDKLRADIAAKEAAMQGADTALKKDEAALKALEQQLSE